MSHKEKFILRHGRVPLLVSMPHVGEHIPDDIAVGLTPAALQIADTDWHLDRLYDFLDELGVSVLVATHSRYVIDLNRPLDDTSLYPGQDTTGLFPFDTFRKESLYQHGREPDDAEMARRGSSYWQPYHAALSAELQRLRSEHGMAMLWEAHSICSEVPRFFDGRLPDLNLGTASGAACAPDLAQRLLQVAEQAPGYTHAMNGRFKGGHITRHYGKPAEHIHAVQLELSQATYMEEHLPFRFDEQLANNVRPTLRRFMETMLDWARA
ncbi:MAG: N-formylglutamate deformylase [Herminiimonas sp.]|nr:N-formylglutamate deformylase [Herminiimonas sp.]